MEHEASINNMMVPSADPPPLLSPSVTALSAQDTDVNARPIVRADCIKFVYTFRNQFSVEQLLALMPMLIAHLQSEHVSLLLLLPLRFPESTPCCS